MRTVVYTAIIGARDDLKNPKVVDEGVDYICFTDCPSLFQGRKTPWRIVPVESSNDPVRQARRIKILAHDYVGEYERSLWIDGKVRIWGSLHPLLQRHGATTLMAWQHWQRNCVYTESRACIRLGKDRAKVIKAQIDAYLKEGMPRNYGLIRSEVLLRLHNRPQIRQAMEAWWQEVYNRSRRDQLSFPYIVWKLKLKYTRNLSQKEFQQHFKVYKHTR